MASFYQALRSSLILSRIAQSPHQPPRLLAFASFSPATITNNNSNNNHIYKRTLHTPSRTYSTASKPPQLPSLTLPVLTTDPALTSTATYLQNFVLPLKLCPFAARPLQTHTAEFKLIKFDTSSYGFEEGEMERGLNALKGVIEEEAHTMINLDKQNKRLTTMLVVTPPTNPDTKSSVYDFLNDEFIDFMGYLDQEVNVCSVFDEGLVQVAPFHPKFEFGDEEFYDDDDDDDKEHEDGDDDDDDDGVDGDKNREDPNSVQNYVNRSPHPTFHLLLESQVTLAISSYNHTAGKKKAAGLSGLTGMVDDVWVRNGEVLEFIGRKEVEGLIDGSVGGVTSRDVQEYIKNR